MASQSSYLDLRAPGLTELRMQRTHESPLHQSFMTIEGGFRTALGAG